MKESLVLLLYRSLLPLLFIFAFPGWIIKMVKRGGFKTALNERLGIYLAQINNEPTGAVHFHAVSVGETLVALKLLRAWSNQFPETEFVIATGTSTAHDIATDAKIPNLRVTYSPLDFAWTVKSYFKRFKPSKIVLIEGEIWPNLLRIAGKKQIPVHLANARVSPRSAKRFVKFADLLRPFFSKLSSVCIQEKEHRQLWQLLGIADENIHLTGNIKFDPQSSEPPPLRPDFTEMLATFGRGRPLILAASTFPGEEVLLADAIETALPNALPIIVPRHAERRSEVLLALRNAGFSVTLRSSFTSPAPSQRQVFVIDSTGELATWTSHADLVIIGKSFLSTGGQNPAEAILARKPVIFGPHMENFQPLARDLLEANAALSGQGKCEIVTAIRDSLIHTDTLLLTDKAFQILSSHKGAAIRHLRVLHPHPQPA
ncbi:MAG: hypothetical protein H7Y36_02690 [Armatimonadetes bacterium]|nr:hypothetical protein [Akkermansiaceae bacterium]